MFDKIIDFSLIALIIFSFILGILGFIEKNNKIELDIINKTRNYTIFSSCKKISDKYYCWEDE